MEDTYMEKYLPLIQEYTFASELVGVSFEAAAAFTRARETWLGGGISSLTLVEASPLLLDLAQQIDQVKSRTGWPHIFVRLSSRSPKDAALNSPRFQGIYAEELRSLRIEQANQIDQTSDLNTNLHALYRASTWCLALTSGLEACQTLIESARTADDLRARGAGEIQTEFNLVVREFRHFPVELEFRGFIHQRKLTGLTQYNEFCYFPILQTIQQQLLGLLVAEFESVLPKIPLDSFVVDFVLATASEQSAGAALDMDKRLQLPLEDYHVRLIELNPLAEFAGTGLFDWLRDKPVLLGQKPFEFRFHASLPSPTLVLANMTPAWREKIGS
eukprot:c12877_g1_i1.p1 GENE.c12877_g1_i1~~c12877_g1_i1.p1  ORF type:complete len:384 (+),score=74.82 c12877_g1_i1:163-1152(+)